MKLFHATDELIDPKPRYGPLLSLSLNVKKYDNGVLGLWCALESSWLELFGNTLYSFTLEEDAKPLAIQIEDIEGEESKLDYVLWRKKLLSEGYDYLLISGDDGPYCAVILNFDKILNWKRL